MYNLLVIAVEGTFMAVTMVMIFHKLGYGAPKNYGEKKMPHPLKWNCAPKYLVHVRWVDLVGIMPTREVLEDTLW